MIGFMIELYTHATPNGHKVSILLEELGLRYRLHLVDLVKNASEAELLCMVTQQKAGG